MLWKIFIFYFFMYREVEFVSGFERAFFIIYVKKSHFRSWIKV